MFASLRFNVGSAGWWVRLGDSAKGEAGFGVLVLSIYRYGAMDGPFYFGLDRYEIWRLVRVCMYHNPHDWTKVMHAMTAGMVSCIEEL